MATPLKTFIIYARADAAFKDELLTHLHLFVENKFIKSFVDTDVLPGEDWEKRIEKELYDAHLVIMLVSSDALSSSFIQKKELKNALEKKRDGSARVVPILVRDCYWKLHPELSEIQLLPKDETGKIRGVAAWLSRDSAWVQCCEELHKLILEIRAELEKDAALLAQKNEHEAQTKLEEAEKNEKNRHRRDEAAWEKVLADAEKADDPAHKIISFETYLEEAEYQNHRNEAEEKLEDLKTEIKTAQKLEDARNAALRKKADDAEALRLQEAAEKKRKAAEALRQREAAEKKQNADEAAKALRQREAADKKQKADEAARQKDLPDMVLVKGGSFLMGSPKNETGRYDNEVQHSVTLSDFCIGKYPVTQKLWKNIMGSNPANFKGDDLPVESVTWDDCQAFLKKLNQKTGKNYRLPSEAEWEFAARGGTLSKGFLYSGSNTLSETGWFWENSGDKPLSGKWNGDLAVKNNCHTYPVGKKSANELGLYDMSGNVCEWCADWDGAYPTGTQANPTGSAKGSFRVNRGGSWYFQALHCRVARRHSFSPGDRYSNLGFRLASSPQ